MSNEFIEEPISPSIQDLLTIFKNDLSAINFPDVNQEVLDALVQKVASSAKNLQEALTAVQAARDSLEAAQNELTSKAVRALAYAKVFAEGNDALLEKLSRISLGKTSRSPKKSALEKMSAEKPQPETVSRESQKIDDKKHSKSSKKSGELAVEDTVEK
jgi:hypothetical protein